MLLSAAISCGLIEAIEGLDELVDFVRLSAAISCGLIEAGVHSLDGGGRLRLSAAISCGLIEAVYCGGMQKSVLLCYPQL